MLSYHPAVGAMVKLSNLPSTTLILQAANRETDDTEVAAEVEVAGAIVQDAAPGIGPRLDVGGPQTTAGGQVDETSVVVPKAAW